MSSNFSKQKNSFIKRIMLNNTEGGYKALQATKKIILNYHKWGYDEGRGKTDRFFMSRKKREYLKKVELNIPREFFTISVADLERRLREAYNRGYKERIKEGYYD